MGDLRRDHALSVPRGAGFSLIEVMAAVTILLIASVGTLSLHAVGLRMNSDARIMTRASAMAQDLVQQMQAWDYANDPRLANTSTANDTDYADSAAAFQQPDGSFIFDHQESELESQGTSYPWLGIPSATAQGLGMTRYWNVAEVDFDPSTGALNGRRVAVIVRWQSDRMVRRLVLVTFLRNPAAS